MYYIRSFIGTDIEKIYIDKYKLTCFTMEGGDGLADAAIKKLLIQIKKINDQLQQGDTFCIDVVEEVLQSEYSGEAAELKEEFIRIINELLNRNEQIAHDKVDLDEYMHKLTYTNIELLSSKSELEAAHSQLIAYTEEIERMNLELNRKVEELKNLFHFSQEISSTLDFQELLRRILRDISPTINASFGSILFKDDLHNGKMKLIDTYYKDQKVFDLIQPYTKFFLKRGYLAYDFEFTKLTIIEDIAQHSFIKEKVNVFDRNECKALAVVPVMNKQKEVLAMMFFIADYFDNGDQYLLSCYSNVLGIALENAKLYHDINTMFFDTVKVLANAIEVKDTYTKGHVDRVMDYSVFIAKKMNFSKTQVEQIKIAAVLHDIGKIGVPDDILNKPSKLSDEEFEVIKLHPMKGFEIIKDIPALKNISVHVKQHHERMDGKGYPEGLYDGQISMEAKIISVADAFDAMTSDRPYRKGMTYEKAVEIILENQGSQFDAKVVSVFLDVLKEQENFNYKSIQAVKAINAKI